VLIAKLNSKGTKVKILKEGEEENTPNASPVKTSKNPNPKSSVKKNKNAAKMS